MDRTDYTDHMADFVDVETATDVLQDSPAAPTLSDAEADDRLDFFVKKDGQVFAGTHLIVDLEGVTRIDDADHIESSLIAAAQKAGATVLNSDFHVFSPNNGVSGVIVLAESHISIHTWPERNFAAVDVFMCGACNPSDTIPVLKEAFKPSHMTVQEIKRGLQI